MKIHGLAAVAAVGVYLSGCASITSGTTQRIAIITPPLSGATCYLRNPEGVWRVFSPGIAEIQRSKDDLEVKCRKEGWNDAFMTLPSNLEYWTAGNILMGGGGATVAGIGIDSATGAINEYPRVLPVPMTRIGSPAVASVPSPQAQAAAKPAPTPAAPPDNNHTALLLN